MRSSVIVDQEAMEWSAMTEGPSPGIVAKVFSVDEETGALAGIAKLPAGSYEPRHGHPCSCDILILEGKMINTETGQKMSKGMYWHIPEGELHGPLRVSEDEDCIIFIVIDGHLNPMIEP